MQLLQILACGVIYFLIIYLFVIRREARPIIPWVVCILTQVVSIVFFYDVVALFKSFLPEEQYGSLGMVIPSALLCAVNLTVIFIMFGRVMDNINKKDAEPVRKEEKIRIAPLPSVVNQNAVREEKNDSESDITIPFIEKMIAEGRKDEALKYLKMLAYYSKDEQTKKEASELIAKLNTTGE